MAEKSTFDTSQIAPVDSEQEFEQVSLIEPTDHHYLLIAAEVDRPRLPVFLTTSAKKRDLLNFCKNRCTQIEERPTISSAVVFKALLIPPGRGKFLKERTGQVHIARFDVVVLIEVADKQAANDLRQDERYKQLLSTITDASSHIYTISATNVKHIGPVDHNRRGVFLFNYFFADDVEQNLGIWEYTAGWFQQETGLDNSTVLLPDRTEQSDYAIINHCRWDSLFDILPSILFKSSFKSYVLENFYKNNVAAIPILYKLA